MHKPSPIFMLAVALAVTAPVVARDAEKPTTAQLREDLQYFARNLPRKHKNAFHYTTKEQFEAAVEDLDGRLEHLDEDQFYTGVMRLASMIGDAHTAAGIPRKAQRLFPMVVHRFDEGYRLVQVGPDLAEVLGARIVKIDDTPAEQFCPILSPLTAQNENPSLAPAMVNLLLSDARVLHGTGITAQREKASFTLEDDSGRQFSLDVSAVSADEYLATKWIRPFKDTELSRISEPMHHASPTFDYTYVPKANAVFANVRRMADLRKPTRELLDFIRARQPDKLIIDLRANPGGDYFKGLHHLIEPIAKLPTINRNGHLFVIIGPLTGSAAVINAVQFHTMTQAILVGEPIGAKPSEYSEHRTMTLPNTRLTIGYSVRYYDFSYNKENVVQPEHEVKATWDDFKRGVNPALEWCLAHETK